MLIILCIAVGFAIGILTCTLIISFNEFKINDKKVEWYEEDLSELNYKEIKEIARKATKALEESNRKNGK